MARGGSLEPRLTTLPELPEVETIVGQLNEALPGRRIASVEVMRPNVVRGRPVTFARRLTGRWVDAVQRRAKFIVAELDDGRKWLTHLRMSGRYEISYGGSSASPPAYARVALRLEGGVCLWYVDVRTLGLLEIVSAAEWQRRDEHLGPEPLDPSFTPEVLQTRLGLTRQPIKTFLLDQHRIAGLGNIYAAEALWRAGVSPRRRARNVGPARARRLHRAIVDVLSEAVAGHGTSLGATYLNFADPDGDRGAFYDALAVYDREGQPCRRCGAEIRRIIQAQRSTYYCPTCQR